jgi:hypothetical protein
MLSDALNVILRASHDPLSMTRSIREAVRTVDPNQPMNVVSTAEDALASAGWARERFVALLLLGFAVFALMLAIVGALPRFSRQTRFGSTELAQGPGDQASVRSRTIFGFTSSLPSRDSRRFSRS